jgi:protein ImuB
MIACILLPGTPNVNRLWPILSDFSSGIEWIETHPVPAVYLDFGHLPGPREVAQTLAQAVHKEMPAAPTVGVAAGKFIAYAAALSAKGNAVLAIAPGHEASFLAPLPVDLLPLTEETGRRLHLLGIRTLGQLAALPAGAVLTQLGAEGRLWQQWSRGHDHRPVVSRPPRPLESSVHQFDEPIVDRIALEALLAAMAAELAARLRDKGLASRQVQLTLSLEDRTTRQTQLVVRQPTANAERLAQIFKELLSHSPTRSGVVAVEVALADVTPALGRQLDLFTQGVEQDRRLREALKDLAARHGRERFYQPSLPHPEARLPERRFRLNDIDLP